MHIPPGGGQPPHRHDFEESLFFAQVGVPVATRTTRPPKLDKADQAASMKKAEELALAYRTELFQQSP